MPDVQVAVGLRRKAGDDAAVVLAGLPVRGDNFADEMGRHRVGAGVVHLVRGLCHGWPLDAGRPASKGRYGSISAPPDNEPCPLLTG